MPRIGTTDNKCIACDGKGKSSKGGKCLPCNGTGRKINVGVRYPEQDGKRYARSKGRTS